MICYGKDKVSAQIQSVPSSDNAFSSACISNAEKYKVQL